MQDKLNESIDTDYMAVHDSYCAWLKPLANKYMTNEQYIMMEWYHSIMSKLSSMRAELSSCQL